MCGHMITHPISKHTALLYNKIIFSITIIFIMEHLKKSQILKLFIIAALLVIAPLLSTSFRSTYLYFILNILILLVGAESGLLSFFLHSPENKKAAALVSAHGDRDRDHDHNERTSADHDQFRNKNAGEDRNGGGAKVKKSPSSPSIFFIEGGEADETIVEEVAGDESSQELYHKAENFIGNFYKQLKMQREESWKKLHDLYHKAF